MNYENALKMDFDNEDTVDDTSYINDVRDSRDLRDVSFSNYRKREVKNVLLDNMLKYKIEPAFYWCAELLCAGHFMDIWEIILYFIGKHIHLGNPKLVVYLDNRFQVFRNVISQSSYLTDLQIRNNSKIRRLFMELICVLTYSPRKHTIELIKINRVEEFDISQMTAERLKAPSIQFAKVLYDNKDDPKELFIAMNEFSYNICKKGGQNLTRACYWIEWMIEFDSLCKKKKQVCKCRKRDFIPYTVELKYTRDIVWMIWDSILFYANADEHGKYVTTLLRSILNLFSIKYSTGSTKKRRYLLYYAVSLLMEPVPNHIDIISDEHKAILVSALSQIDMIYLQIKQNEQVPQTEYLFRNIGGGAGGAPSKGGAKGTPKNLPYNVPPPPRHIPQSVSNVADVFDDDDEDV
jgi:hypothetical protein